MNHTERGGKKKKKGGREKRSKGFLAKRGWGEICQRGAPFGNNGKKENGGGNATKPSPLREGGKKGRGGSKRKKEPLKVLGPWKKEKKKKKGEKKCEERILTRRDRASGMERGGGKKSLVRLSRILPHDRKEKRERGGTNWRGRKSGAQSFITILNKHLGKKERKRGGKEGGKENDSHPIVP